MQRVFRLLSVFALVMMLSVPLAAASATPRSATANGYLFLGDSISDNGFLPSSGNYADTVVGTLNVPRLNQTAGDPNRAAIAGGPLEYLAANDNNALEGFPRRVAPFAPRNLVIYLGTNDYLYSVQYGKTPDTYAAAWDALYTQIAALPTPDHVIVLGMRLYVPPLGGQTPAWGPNYLTAQAMLNSVAKSKAEQHGAVYVSLDFLLPSDMVGDQIHSNARGQAKIAQAVLGAISSPTFTVPTSTSTSPPSRPSAAPTYGPIASSPPRHGPAPTATVSALYGPTATPQPHPARHGDG